MTSYLGSLARRSVAPQSAVRPRLRGLFEPLPGAVYLRPPGPVEADDLPVAEGTVALRGVLARSPAPPRAVPAAARSGTRWEPPAEPSPEPRGTRSRARGAAAAKVSRSEGAGDESGDGKAADERAARVLPAHARPAAAAEVHVEAADAPPSRRFPSSASTHDRPRPPARDGGERPEVRVVPPSSGRRRVAAARHDGELPGVAIAVVEQGGLPIPSEEAVDREDDGPPRLRSPSRPERTVARDPWPAQAPSGIPAAPVVHVTIGRIDVRATPAEQPAPRSRRDRRTAMTLAEYLENRDSGR